MKHGFLYIWLFSAGAAGFVAWRVHAIRHREIPHYEIVVDASGSHWQGCGSLLGLTGHILAAERRTKGSTLTVLTLGDLSSANEPRRMGVYPLPFVRKALEGRSARLTEERRILSDLSVRCASLGRTSISPIFAGVEAALADLRAHGCNGSSGCKLFVDSDGEETVEATVRKGIERSAKRSSLTPLNNGGIDVVFCGLAARHTLGNDRSTNRLQRSRSRLAGDPYRIEEIWRPLFTERDGVTFAPYCPQSSGVDD